MHAHVHDRPYWHCLAFAGIWYAAIVLLNLADGGAARTALNLADGGAARTALLGVVPWIGASIALWRVAHGGMKGWRLILLGLPIFYFLWALTIVVAYRFVVPVTG